MTLYQLQESHDIMRAFLAEAKRYEVCMCNTVKAFVSIAEAAERSQRKQCVGCVRARKCASMALAVSSAR